MVRGVSDQLPLILYITSKNVTQIAAILTTLGQVFYNSQFIGQALQQLLEVEHGFDNEIASHYRILLIDTLDRFGREFWGKGFDLDR